MLRFIVGFIYIVFSFPEIKIILTLFLLTLSKSILIKFQNDHTLYNRHNWLCFNIIVFIEVNKKLLDAFLK